MYEHDYPCACGAIRDWTTTDPEANRHSVIVCEGDEGERSDMPTGLLTFPGNG